MRRALALSLHALRIMQDSDLEGIFFKAQDSQDASLKARLFSQITSTVVSDDPGRIVSSAAHNSLAELKIDEAMALGFPMTVHDDVSVLDARRLLRQAISKLEAARQRREAVDSLHL